MNWFTRIFSKAAGAAQSRVSALVSLIPEYLSGLKWLINDQFLNLARHGYNQNSVVYACLRLLSQAVPEPPLCIYEDQDDGEVELKDHPLRQLIKRPNPIMTEFEFIEMLMLHLGICGKSYWWKQRGNDGSVINLWPLRPDRMNPIYGKGAVPLAGWLYNLDGIWYNLPTADIFFVRLPDVAGMSGGLVEGIGPLQVLSREVETDNNATGFVKALLDNFAMPGIVVTSKKRLDEPKAKALKEQFKRKYGGNKLGDVAILDDETTVQTMSFNLRDLEFPSLRAIGEARTAAAFGVPPILVGLKAGLDRATYSNAEQAREFFSETTLSSYWRRIQDAVQLQLLPDFQAEGESLIVRFDISKVRALQSAYEKQSAQLLLALQNGCLTVNEYRAQVLHMTATADGDVRHVPTTVVEVLAPAPLPQKALPQFDYSRDYTPDKMGKLKGLLPS